MEIITKPHGEVQERAVLQVRTNADGIIQFNLKKRYHIGLETTKLHTKMGIRFPFHYQLT